MLNKFAKMLLVGTAIAPTLLIMGVDSICRPDFKGWVFPISLFVIVALLVLIAMLVMSYGFKNVGTQSLTITKAKNSDKEVLPFLLAYLLPILNDHKYLFKEYNIPTLALLALVAVAVYHSNAFDFNPFLGMLGYHFYEVQDDDNFPYLLISKKPLLKPCQSLKVVQLFDYTFLYVGD